MQQQLNQPRTMNGWALFDWANSAFALVITTAIFPPYFETVIDKEFTVAGMEFSNSSWLAFTISISYLIIAVLSPILSGIADAGGRRKFFLSMFTTMGGIACISLYWFKEMEDLWLGTLGFALGLIGFAGGLVFYNSFLPVIATQDRFDNLSARGFAMGYIGSVLLLVFNLAMVLNPSWFGIPDDKTAVLLAFVTVGIWWLVFGYIAFSRLPADVRKKSAGLADVSRKGWREFTSVWKRVKSSKPTLRFLGAFFSYSAGVQTVIFLASAFASKELGFESSELIQGIFAPNGTR